MISKNQGNQGASVPKIEVLRNSLCSISLDPLQESTVSLRFAWFPIQLIIEISSFYFFLKFFTFQVSSLRSVKISWASEKDVLSINFFCPIHANYRSFSKIRIPCGYLHAANNYWHNLCSDCKYLFSKYVPRN